MTSNWSTLDTTKHQDHVIAHVIGAKLLAYFVHDEVFYGLLDIGFIWSILLDAEMGLLPHPVAINELALEEQTKSKIRHDVDLLLLNDDGRALELLSRLPLEFEIEQASLWEDGADRRCLLYGGNDEELEITTSIPRREFQIMLRDENEKSGTGADDALDNVAASEHEYLHERLRAELGREPTEAELDEWLRRHTEAL
jgi:hypothetical protein